MYFLTTLVCTIITGVLWFFFKDRKSLHLEILTITFGSSTLMWLIDCIFTAAEGEPFLSFDDPTDGWIALTAFAGAIFFWIVLSFILNNNKRVENFKINFTEKISLFHQNFWQRFVSQFFYKNFAVSQ